MTPRPSKIQLTATQAFTAIKQYEHNFTNLTSGFESK